MHRKPSTPDHNLRRTKPNLFEQEYVEQLLVEDANNMNEDDIINPFVLEERG